MALYLNCVDNYKTQIVMIRTLLITNLHEMVSSKILSLIIYTIYTSTKITKSGFCAHFYFDIIFWFQIYVFVKTKIPTTLFCCRVTFFWATNMGTLGLRIVMRFCIFSFEENKDTLKFMDPGSIWYQYAICFPIASFHISGA